MVSVNDGKAMLTGMVPAHSHRANTSRIEVPFKSHEDALMRLGWLRVRAPTP